MKRSHPAQNFFFYLGGGRECMFFAEVPLRTQSHWKRCVIFDWKIPAKRYVLVKINLGTAARVLLLDLCTCPWVCSKVRIKKVKCSNYRMFTNRASGLWRRPPTFTVVVVIEFLESNNSARIQVTNLYRKCAAKKQSTYIYIWSSLNIVKSSMVIIWLGTVSGSSYTEVISNWNTN